MLRHFNRIACGGIAVCLLSQVSYSAHAQSAYDRAQDAIESGRFEEAIRLLEPEVETGDASYKSLLAFAYVSLNTEEGDSKGAPLLLEAAAAGDAAAQLVLGLGYANGHYGLPHDETMAVKWLIPSARRGVSEAQFVIGSYYVSGSGGLAEDPRAAACWLRNAANRGHGRAQYNLGWMIVMSKGVPEDYVEAYKWFNLAAAEGLDKAIEMRAALRPLLAPEQLGVAQAASTAFVPQDELLLDNSVDC